MALSNLIENRQSVVVSGDDLIKKLEQISDRLEKIGRVATNKDKIKAKKDDEEDNDMGTFKDFTRGFAKGIMAPILPFFNPFEQKKDQKDKQDKPEDTETKKPSVPTNESNILASTVAELSKGTSLQEKMLEELTVLRKITEGSLEFNKKSLKYTDPVTKRMVSRDLAKAREEDIYIDEEGKAKVRKKINADVPNPLKPAALEPSDITQKEKDKAEDRELLAEAIARRLAGLLGGQGPNIEIDMDRRRRGPSTVPGPADIPDADRKPTGGGSPGEPKKPNPEGGGGKVPSKIPGRIGKGLFALDAVLSAYEIGQIEKEKEEGKIDKKTANEKQAGIVGGLAGAGAGAAIGAGFGSAFGGVGAIPGAIIGGIIGALGGKFGSEKVANVVLNSNLVENKDTVKPAYPDNKWYSLSTESTIKENLDRSKELKMQNVLPINNTNIVTNNNTELVPIKGTPRNNDPSIVRKLDQVNNFR
ncbi:MAG: hypothetical protein EBU90_07510 [Proteobacteria bacterium]|nr:hypothetical protein [Pseudomonadota bacterium]NBP13449.1 hypothetical protein [bacterium]